MRVDKLTRRAEIIPILLELIELHIKIRQEGNKCIKAYSEWQVLRSRNVRTYYTANLSQVKQAWERLDRDMDLLYKRHARLWYEAHCVYADLPFDQHNKQLSYVKMSERYYAQSYHKEEYKIIKQKLEEEMKNELK